LQYSQHKNSSIKIKNELRFLNPLKFRFFALVFRMKNKWIKGILTAGIVTLIGALWIFIFQKVRLSDNNSPTESIGILKIESHWSQEKLNDFVNDSLGVYFPRGISFWLDFLDYEITPCKIGIENNESAFSLLKKIHQSRNQTVNLVIRSSHYKEGFCKSISNQIGINKLDLDSFLNDSHIINKQSITKENWPIYIIPNTYNIRYNVSITDFFNRMIEESTTFWNKERVDKLKNQKLSKMDVITIASIVEKESCKVDEFENIAGVYINRYRKNMRLQADPTIVFIKGKAERVLQADTKIASPYNTYLHTGLPPGPICIPSIQAIDAVLNYRQHDFIYFCAKSDFSGYHIFESDYSRHLKNAKKFHDALNQQK
jgi:UPF0755 protein